MTRKKMDQKARDFHKNPSPHNQRDFMQARTEYIQEVKDFYEKNQGKSEVQLVKAAETTDIDLVDLYEEIHRREIESQAIAKETQMKTPPETVIPLEEQATHAAMKKEKVDGKPKIIPNTFKEK